MRKLHTPGRLTGETARLMRAHLRGRLDDDYLVWRHGGDWYLSVHGKAGPGLEPRFVVNGEPRDPQAFVDGLFASGALPPDARRLVVVCCHPAYFAGRVRAGGADAEFAGPGETGEVLVFFSRCGKLSVATGRGPGRRARAAGRAR